MAVVERSVEQLELSWDGRCALIASWSIVLVKALQQLVAADARRRDRLLQGMLPEVVERGLLDARLVRRETGREKASAMGSICV